jgi:hypothetical protein
MSISFLLPVGVDGLNAVPTMVLAASKGSVPPPVGATLRIIRAVDDSATLEELYYVANVELVIQMATDDTIMDEQYDVMVSPANPAAAARINRWYGREKGQE